MNYQKKTRTENNKNRKQSQKPDENKTTPHKEANKIFPSGKGRNQLKVKWFKEEYK